jgi:hypothetical protein
MFLAGLPLRRVASQWLAKGTQKPCPEDLPLRVTGRLSSLQKFLGSFATYHPHFVVGAR